MGNYPTSDYIIAIIFFVIVIGGPIYALWSLVHCKECGYREGREDIPSSSPTTG